MQAPIYLDHHATTPTDPRVLEAMLPYFTERFGNPSSRAHAQGRQARAAVEAARAQLAALLDAEPEGLVFTSGATESDNLALLGFLEGLEGARLIVPVTEHSAVLDSARVLEKRGVAVTRLPVGPEGLLAIEALEEALEGAGPSTLVSVMLANNEVGAAHPLEAIAPLVRARGALLHCDAAQGLGYLPLSVRALGLDLVSVSGHKIYGPKGVGALYVRPAIRHRLRPLSHGGGHEGGLRSGSLNVPGVVGLGAAAHLAREEGPAEARRLRGLSARLYEGLAAGVPELALNGPPLGPRRHPGNLNVLVPFVEADALLLDLADTLSLSTGSACSSERPSPSHVLRALGLSLEQSKSSLRFGLGRGSTEAEVDLAIARVVEAVAQRRERSPLWALHREGRSVAW